MINARKIIPSEKEGELILVPFSVSAGGREVRLAVNVQKILEVVEMEELTPVPEGHRPFIGILDHRLGPIPVMDLAGVIGGHPAGSPTAKPSPQSRIVICAVQRFVIGIIAERTRRIERHRNSTILPVPEVMESMEPHYFNGMIRAEGGILYMLDIEAILESRGIRFTGGEGVDPGIAGRFMEGKRVLVAEDSRLFQKRIRAIFSDMGALCDVAEDGRAALELLSNPANEYVLVFTDVEMPRMNGIELAREVKARHGIPVLFNSSISNPALIAEIEGESLGEYLVKFDEAVIRRKVKSILEKGNADARQ